MKIDNRVGSGSARRIITTEEQSFFIRARCSNKSSGASVKNGECSDDTIFITSFEKKKTEVFSEKYSIKSRLKSLAARVYAESQSIAGISTDRDITENFAGCLELNCSCYRKT